MTFGSAPILNTVKGLVVAGAAGLGFIGGDMAVDHRRVYDLHSHLHKYVEEAPQPDENPINYIKSTGDCLVKVADTLDQPAGYLPWLTAGFAGVLALIAAGKPIKAKFIEDNFDDLMTSLKETAKVGSFLYPLRSSDSQQYEIDFQKLFYETLAKIFEERVYDGHSRIRGLVAQHRDDFLEMFRNLALRGDLDSAKLLILYSGSLMLRPQAFEDTLNKLNKGLPENFDLAQLAKTKRALTEFLQKTSKVM